MPNGTINQMAGQDDYLYLASIDGLNVIDVSRPASPMQVSRYYLPQNIRAMTVQDHYLYLAEEDPQNNYKGRVHSLDISNPISLTEEGYGWASYSRHQVAAHLIFGGLVLP